MEQLLRSDFNPTDEEAIILFHQDSLPKALIVYINGITSKRGLELLFSSSDNSDPLLYNDGALYIGPAFVFDAINVLGFQNPGAIGATQVATSGTSGGHGYSVEMSGLEDNIYSIADPDGFTWPVGIPRPEFYVSNGDVVLNSDFSSFIPTGTKAYWVTPTGSDGNDGLSEATALRSVATAVAKSDVDIVYIKTGIYRRDKSWQGVTPTRDISVIAVDGPVTLTSCDIKTWGADTTYPNIFTTARSAVYMVRDTSSYNVDGSSFLLENVESALECSNLQNSYYTDGASVWVNLHDSRVPDDDLRLYVTSSGGVIENTSLYMEGITFESVTPFVASNIVLGVRSKVYMKDCVFRYSGDAGNGLRIVGSVDVILEDCVSNHNALDGFNYHAAATYIPAVLEVNCVGSYNGDDSTYSSNGSSIHDAGTAIRLGGVYEKNGGPNIADIDTSNTWCVGSVARDSVTETVNISDFYTEGLMWLDNCTGDVFNNTGGTLYTVDTSSGIMQAGVVSNYVRTFEQQTYENESLLRCYRGDLSENLFVDPTTGYLASTTYSEYDSETEECHIVSGGTNIGISSSVEAGKKYNITIEILEVLSGSIKVGTDSIFSNILPLVDTVGTYTILNHTADTDTIAAFRTYGEISDVTFTMKVVEVTAVPMTTAITVRMAQGSTSITSTQNIVTVNNTAIGLIYMDAGGTIKCTDGTNVASVTVAGGWLDGDYITLRLSGTATTLTMGYALEGDTVFTDGTPVAYVGTFGPGTHIRYGYGVTQAHGNLQIQQWNKLATDEEILSLV